jgi:hypothetical protein
MAKAGSGILSPVLLSTVCGEKHAYESVQMQPGVGKASQHVCSDIQLIGAASYQVLLFRRL